MWHWFLTWMLVCVCVCASVASEGKWMQLRLIRVQSVPVVLSQSPLSFNMPFPMWISLSHVTKLDTHISSRPFFPFRGSCFSSLSVPLCEVPPSPSPPSTIHAATKSDSLSGPSACSSSTSQHPFTQQYIEDRNYGLSKLLWKPRKTGKLERRSTHRLIKPEKSIKWNYLLVFFIKLVFGAAVLCWY